MSFHAFEQAIESPTLRLIAQYWNQVRGSRAMPGWGNIRPSQITAHLPIIWSYKYDRVADAFTGRLAGDKIEQIFGKGFRGVPMAELYPAENFPKFFLKSKRVVCEPALYIGKGMVFKYVDRHGQGERIIMPLADDGVLGDGIFGATVYQSLLGAPAADDSEHESWFPL